MTSTEELIAGLKKATGPSKEIDRRIAAVMGWQRITPSQMRKKYGGWIAPEDYIGRMSDGSPICDSLHGTTIHRDVPDYTASIDAAMTLYKRAPERIPSNALDVCKEALQQWL